MSSFDIKLPNITSPTERGQLEQIRSYLYQLAEQLKWALNSFNANEGKVVQQSSQSVKVVSTKESPNATFNSIKALIIKSADIINAYYDVINEKLSGQYIAQSDFGIYAEQTQQEINKSSTEIESLFTNLQEIISEVDGIESSIIDVNAHVKAGLLYYDNGVPIYGLEIGQNNIIDGEEVFYKYARFISDRLSFYDQNNIEVAYISDFTLYITNAHITGTLTIGRYEFDSSDGLAIKWV